MRRSQRRPLVQLAAPLLAPAGKFALSLPPPLPDRQSRLAPTCGQLGILAWSPPPRGSIGCRSPLPARPTAGTRQIESAMLAAERARRQPAARRRGGRRAVCAGPTISTCFICPRFLRRRDNAEPRGPPQAYSEAPLVVSKPHFGRRRRR